MADAGLVAASRQRQVGSIDHLTHLTRRPQPEPKPIGLRGRQAAAVPTDELLALAARVARLGPDRRDPERFHLDRSEIVAELRRLARVLGTAA